jgi:hypothetical protein
MLTTVVCYPPESDCTATSMRVWSFAFNTMFCFSANLNPEPSALTMCHPVLVKFSLPDLEKAPTTVDKLAQKAVGDNTHLT